ncbi:hypothetical protein J6590_103863 [Homalodisca vitripennis]|nr:hypothetical protein J6590_103863 [Homalodisca vitripennis]
MARVRRAIPPQASNHLALSSIQLSLSRHRSRAIKYTTVPQPPPISRYPVYNCRSAATDLVLYSIQKLMSPKIQYVRSLTELSLYLTKTKINRSQSSSFHRFRCTAMVVNLLLPFLHST